MECLLYEYSFSFIALLEDSKRLEGIYQRLHNIQRCPEIVRRVPKAFKAMVMVRDTAIKLHDVLEDLVAHLQRVQAEDPSSPILLPFIDEISQLQPLSLPFGRRLSEIISGIEACSYSLVLQGTHTIYGSYHHY